MVLVEEALILSNCLIDPLRENSSDKLSRDGQESDGCEVERLAGVFVLLGDEADIAFGEADGKGSVFHCFVGHVGDRLS